MDLVKLTQVIHDKNNRFEQDALRTAEQIIEQIVHEQQAITDANKRIVELRQELIALQVPVLNTTEILGDR